MSRAIYDRNDYQKWDKNPIIYAIAPTINNVEQTRKIERALELWSQNTCIRFRKETNPPSTVNHLYFDAPAAGTTACTTNLGRQGGRQLIGLTGSCFNLRIISQLIGRALGVIYEIQRRDRDQYIVIESQRLAANAPVSLTTLGAETFNIQYDYGSLMHYYANEYGTGGVANPVFYAKQFRYQRTMGSSFEPSFYDLKSINYYYCNNTCSGENSCSNKGFARPYDCGNCVCPSGYAGRKCLDAAPSLNRDNCPNDVGAYELNERTPPIIISTPGWPDQDYRLGRCNWVFNAKCSNGSLGRVEVVMNMTQFGILQSAEGGQCLHWLEVKYRRDQGMTGLRLCGTPTPPEVAINSEGDRLALIFNADPDSSITESPSVATGRGFRLRVRLLPNSCARRLRRGALYGPWSKWEPCSQPCGGCGVQVRTRNCILECPDLRTCPCEPIQRETRQCNPYVCDTTGKVEYNCFDRSEYF